VEPRRVHLDDAHRAEALEVHVDGIEHEQGLAKVAAVRSRRDARKLDAIRKFTIAEPAVASSIVAGPRSGP
jgi:hypothetical protein